MSNAPSVDPSQLDVGHLAMFVGLAFAAEVEERLAAQGLGDVRFSHGFVIQHLVGAERTIGELAERLEVTQQAASKSVGELEKLGYVERIADPNDARVTRVRLSAKGLKLIETTRKLRATVEKRLTTKHGEATLASIRRHLAALLDSLGGADAVRARKVRLPR